MIGMLAFHDLFPDIGCSETRTVTVLEDEKGRLPPDNYGFLEFYCVDPACDCRRVILNVMSEHGNEQFAVISHAFEPPWPTDPEPEQTFLDPLNPQSKLSGGLLELFKAVLLTDKKYVQRLEWHYRMVKDAVTDPGHPVHDFIAQAEKPANPSGRAKSSPDPYAPCPCGNGKKFKWCCREKDMNGTSIRLVNHAQLNVGNEAEYITSRAVRRDARVVTLGSLIFFSTATGDAWVLDPGDSLARCLAIDGNALPSGITETKQQFTVEWTASYRIFGDAMIFTERSGVERVVVGYPVADIRRAIRMMPTTQ